VGVGNPGRGGFVEIEAIAPIDRAEAAQCLGRVQDPAGIATPASMAATGQPMRVTTEAGELVYVATKRAETLWIEAAQGQGAQDFTALGLELAQRTAQNTGCESVSFQTARRGLVKKAEQHGFKVVGWILKKEV
jgi:hypothetical protein